MIVCSVAENDELGSEGMALMQDHEDSSTKCMPLDFESYLHLVTQDKIYSKTVNALQCLWKGYLSLTEMSLLRSV